MSPPSTTASTHSLSDHLDAAAARHGSHVALSDRGEEIAYVELQQLRNRLARGLAGLGVQRGDRVALMMPNCAAYVVSFFATVHLGAIVVQINPTYTAAEFQRLLGDSGAEVAIVDASAYGTLLSIVEATAVRTIVVAGSAPASLRAGDVAYGDLVARSDSEPLSVSVDPLNDVASLQYTGGTTGVSKGAMLTHSNLLAALDGTASLLIENEDELPPGSAAVALAPFFHIFGLTMVLLLGIQRGWNLVILQRFDPEELIGEIERERPVAMAAVPSVYAALCSNKRARGRGLEHVNLYLSGGAPLSPGLAAEFERVTGRTIWEGYGMSEGAPLAFNGYARGPVPGSIGTPIPGTDVRCVDLDTGEDVPTGSPGELLVRGPQVMRGYWQMPDETANALRDGWLHTGDIAVHSADGTLALVDRKKDVVIVGGFNVYPREIEDALAAHPAVAEAAAIGIDDEYLGEVPKAFVVCRDGEEVSEDDLLDHCSELLAEYKMPYEIEFRAALPKSGVGKVLRNALREDG